jgi:hypothetical protein
MQGRSKGNETSVAFYQIILCHILEVLPTRRTGVAGGGRTTRFIARSGCCSLTIGLSHVYKIETNVARLCKWRLWICGEESGNYLRWRWGHRANAATYWWNAETFHVYFAASVTLLVKLLTARIIPLCFTFIHITQSDPVPTYISNNIKICS